LKSYREPVQSAQGTLIGDWWSFLIIRGAVDGTRRFGEFQKSLGFSKGSLATRLRDLVRCGIFEIVPASDGTAYKEYAIFIADTQVSGKARRPHHFSLKKCKIA
jgi:DNA-binding HxlR family transcriptional regulator